MNKKIVKLPKQNNPSAVRCFLISYHNIHSSGLFSSVTENVRPGTDPKMTRSSRYSTFFLRPSSDTEQLSDHKCDNDKIQQQFKCILFEVSKRFTGTRKHMN